MPYAGNEDPDQLAFQGFLPTYRIDKYCTTSRKHAYSNILKILQPKKENFQIKKSDIFHTPAQNID